MKHRFFLLLLVLLPAACQREVVETRPTIPLVREILAEKSGPRISLLRDRRPQPQEDITLIGGEFACDLLAEQLGCINSDRTDINVGTTAGTELAYDLDRTLRVFVSGTVRFAFG